VNQMRTMLSILLMLLTTAGVVLADETITVAADSTLAGQAGYIVHVTPDNPQDSASSLFFFEEAGKLRMYAARDVGSQDWDIFGSAQYLCPTAPMSLGDTWSHLSSDEGEATLARVVAEEDVTTAAGLFTTFRVEVELVSEPNVSIETMWFAWGVGFVRNQGYEGGAVDWRDNLTSYSIVGGSGYMPLGVGNTWTHAPEAVSTETAGWGELKSLFR